MASIDVRHDGLGRFERLFAPTQALAEERAAALCARWNGEARRRPPGWEAWAGEEAAGRSAEAERQAQALTAILFTAVRAAPASVGSVVFDESLFAEPMPVPPEPPQHEREPQQADFPRRPLTLATLVHPRGLRRRRQDAESKYTNAHDAWRYLKAWRDNEHDKALSTYRAAAAAWQEREAAFKDRQARANTHLVSLLDGARRGEPDGIAALCDFNLLALQRPQGFPCFWTLSVRDGVVTLDYDLPGLDAVPLVKAVKFVPSRGAYDVVVLGEAERERLYGEAVFQSVLAVLHTLFTGAQGVRAVAFNGWANYIDGAALRPGRACIVSVTASREAFEAFDLAAVDPQTCFRALNGTMSAKLAAMLAPNGIS